MHGVAREPTWTFLKSTAKAGLKHIIVERDVDWQIGEEIVIAPT